jgi:hypothetical protein
MYLPSFGLSFASVQNQSPTAIFVSRAVLNLPPSARA